MVELYKQESKKSNQKSKGLMAKPSSYSTNNKLNTYICYLYLSPSALVDQRSHQGDIIAA